MSQFCCFKYIADNTSVQHATMKQTRGNNVGSAQTSLVEVQITGNKSNCGGDMWWYV